MKPILSIIVTIYNLEKYIDECIETLVTQDADENNYEIICINDGSQDSSYQILDTYESKYKNIKVLHKTNAGVSSARNSGIEMAKGKYIWFIDGDDFISYNVLADIIERLKIENPDLLFVKPFSFKDGINTLPLKKGEIVEDESTKCYYDWLWTRIFKREIIINSGVRFDVELSLAEDAMFCTKLDLYIETKDFYDRIVYYYRRRENSLTTCNNKDKLDKLINTSRSFLELSKDEKYDKTFAMSVVYEHLEPVMFCLAKMPRKEADVWIKKLKNLKLYPLKNKPICERDLKNNEMNFDDYILNKLKKISYTRKGYHLLRLWRFFLKSKRRLKH